MSLMGIGQKAQTLLLKASCRLTGGKGPRGSTYRTRVYLGPLRGFMFSMSRLERLSFALGTYEPHIVRCMMGQVRAGMTAYDIGANAGYLTLVLSKLVGPDGIVVAFEPDPKNVAALTRNINDNGVENVTLLQCAASDQNGELTFATFDYSLVGHIARDDTPADAELITVSASRLDDLVYNEGLPVPQFIKIDVEGAESSVIRGSLRLLDEARPVVVAEVRAGQSYDEITKIFKDRGYLQQSLDGGPVLSRDHLSDVLFVPS